MRSYRYTQDDYIKNATAQSLLAYLTESFAYDLENKTASEILNQYGTHIFIRYFKGGSLEANYTYSGTSLKSNAQVKAAVEASYAGVSGGAASSNTSGKNELEQNTSFKYYTYGGKALGATDMVKLKSEYGSWTESIASNADICGIPNNFEQGFIAIWELAKAAGNDGKSTKVSWKDVTIEAKGGKKGGEGGGVSNSKVVPGGKGGETSPRPISDYIKDWDSKSGGNGEPGNFDQNGARSSGGKSAKITGKGSVSNFESDKGAGGNGGYYTDKDASSGTSGGSGFVTVVVHYYTEE